MPPPNAMTMEERWARFGHLLGHGFDAGHALVGFAAWKEDGFPGVGAQGVADVSTVKSPDVSGGDDEDFAALGGDEVGETGKAAAFDEGGVGSLRGGDLKLRHLVHCDIWGETGGGCAEEGWRVGFV